MTLPIEIDAGPPAHRALIDLTRRWWVWALLAVCAVGAAGGLVFLHAGTGLAPEDGARLRVDSSPPAATVRVDGHDRGSTPVDLVLAPGEHDLRLSRPGHADALHRVRLIHGETSSLAAELWSDAPMSRRLRPTLPGAAVSDSGFLADGRVALTLSVPPAGERQVWVLDAAGGAKRMGPPEAPAALSPAPDGRRFAYLARGVTSGRSPSPEGRLDEVWVGERDGEPGRRAYALPPTNQGHLLDLSWAPDARHLLLIARQTLPGGGQRARLLWLDADDGQARELVLIPSEVVPGSYSWSPDGRRVAFLARSGQTTALCLLGVLEPGFTYLADVSRDDTAPLPFAPVAWSPDGRRLAYAAPTDDRPSAVGWLFGPRTAVGLFTLAFDDPVGRRLGDALGQAPAWRGDGALLALARRASDGALDLRLVDGERSDDLLQLPLRSAGAFAARWDLPRAQAIVATRGPASLGATRPEYWWVRFRPEGDR
ncbi:MAG TPA: PEGA domain-containing protein [Chloroflexota bacterium]